MLENLREFIKSVPVLAAMIERELLNQPSHATNTEDQRAYLEKISGGLFERLKADKQLYAVMHFPEQELTCPICRESYFGYYWEINNAATGKGLCLSNRLIHGLVAHEQLFLSESMTTVGGTRVGESRLVLDLAGMAGVFAGAVVPPEVMSDLAAAQAMQAQLLENAGAFQAAGGGH